MWLALVEVGRILLSSHHHRLGPGFKELTQTLRAGIAAFDVVLGGSAIHEATIGFHAHA